MNGQSNTYSAADLARYHAGGMSQTEMHQLEKAALADPFLAEALEGYAYDGAASDNIALLKKQLAGRSKQKPGFFLYSPAAAPWLRVAAIFILFTGMGYAFYRLNDKEKNKELSKNTFKDKKAESPVISSSERPADPINPEPVTEKLSALPGRSERSNKQMSVPGAATGQSAADSLMQEAKYFTRTADGVSTAKDNNKETILSGKVTNNKGQPVEGAVVKITGNDAAVTDENGRFKVQANQQQANMATATGDYSSNNRLDKKMGPSAKNERDYNNAYPNLRGAPVAENGVTLNNALENKSDIEATHHQLQPIDSVVFINYLDKNLKEVMMLSGKPYEGTVILSFTVNKKGDPENIKVEVPLCPPCDEQAVVLLKKGPKWISAGGSKRQVAVEY